MKRILLYILLLLLVLWVPAQRMDIADLRPVQTVAVLPCEEGVCILTDTDDMGEGKDLASALADLKETSSGYIFMDTADYLLVDGSVAEQTLQMKAWMASSVQVYQVEGSPDLKEVSKYLKIRDGGMPIKQWQNDTVLPILDATEERLHLR